MRRLVLLFVIACASVGGFAAPDASAHRNPCHTRHECPSDHATYKWRGLRCVKPTSDARDSSFKKRVRHAGRTYYCKR